MLAPKFKLSDADITDEQRENFRLLRRFLGESGYAILQPISEWRRHHDLDIIVFKKKVPQVQSEPVWIHPGRNGTMVLRSWSGRCQQHHIDALRDAVPSSYRRQLKLRKGRRPFSRKHEAGWESHFSPEELETARLLDYGI